MENPLFLFNHYNILTYSNIELYTNVQDSRLSHSRFKIPAFRFKTQDSRLSHSRFKTQDSLIQDSRLKIPSFQIQDS